MARPRENEWLEYDRFGDYLRFKRDHANMTRKQAAAAIRANGASCVAATVHSLELNKRRPSVQLLLSVVTMFRVSPEEALHALTLAAKEPDRD